MPRKVRKCLAGNLYNPLRFIPCPQGLHLYKAMKKIIIVTAITFGVLLTLALITSIIWISSESQRQGASYSSIDVKHKLQENSSPQEIYEFLKDTAQAARDDGDDDAAADILESLKYLTRTFEQGRKDPRYTETIQNLSRVYLYSLKNADRAHSYLLELYEQRKGIEKNIEKASNEERSAYAETLNDLGNCKSDLSDLPAAIKYLEQARSIVQPLNDVEQKARILYNLSDVYTQDNQWKKALATAIESMKLYEKCPPDANKRDLAEAYSMVGHSFQRDGNLKEAAVYMEKALDRYKLDNIPDSEIVEPLKAAAWMEICAGHKAKAKEILERVLAASPSNDDDDDTQKWAETYVLRRL